MSKPPLRREVLVVLPGLMLAILLAMLDNTIVGTALPTIVGDFGGYNHMSWVVTAYILAATITTPLYGKLGDLYGRKRLFMFAIGVFLIGSAASGAAQSMEQLIAFRALQGLGAGGLMVGVMAILGDLVPPRERGRYQGFMAAVMMVATIGGPLAGGFLTDHVNWRWAFYINLPLGLIALLIIAFTLHLPKHKNKSRIDYFGIILLSIVSAGVVLVTTWGGTQYDWDSWQILTLGGVSVAALVAFLIVESFVSEPVLPLRLFRNRNFSLINVIGFLQGFAMFGAMTFLPMYQQIVQKLTPTESGLFFIPMMLGAMTFSLAAGQIVTRTGRYKIFPILGGAVMIGGMSLLTTLTVDTQEWRLALYMVLFGIGLGLLMQITMLVAQNSAPQNDIGVASSTSTFLRNIGGSVGVAMFGAVFSNRLTDYLTNHKDQLPAKMAAAFTSSDAGSSSGNGLDPSKVSKIPEPFHGIITSGVTDAITTVFIWTIPFAAVAFLLAWFIKEVPLRSTANLKKEDAAPPAEGSDEPVGAVAK
ncbi:MAG TPA: MDR family MFS transporter [Stackebrandtia sp.]|nr:MDR family MFS transporter [Stackebrandtia sp.]HZE38114.1 MDR family MFS transporter [Stackebrandtia sp.]